MLIIINSNRNFYRSTIITALASATGGKTPPPPPGGEAPCSMESRKTRPEENVFKVVENLPALLYMIV